MPDCVVLAEFRILCAAHWSPIGVPMSEATSTSARSSETLPVDENDVYLGEIWMMVQDGRGATEIRAYLASVECDLMGLSSPAGDKDAFARSLRQRWTRS